MKIQKKIDLRKRFGNPENDEMMRMRMMEAAMRVTRRVMEGMEDPGCTEITFPLEDIAFMLSVSEEIASNLSDAQSAIQALGEFAKEYLDHSQNHPESSGLNTAKKMLKGLGVDQTLLDKVMTQVGVRAGQKPTRGQMERMVRKIAEETGIPTAAIEVDETGNMKVTRSDETPEKDENGDPVLRVHKIAEAE